MTEIPKTDCGPVQQRTNENVEEQMTVNGTKYRSIPFGEGEGGWGFIFAKKH
jgi:hypothetical protein